MKTSSIESSLKNKSVIIMDKADNVAVAKHDIEKGSVIELADGSVTTQDSISKGHRLALTDIAKGQSLKQYGSEFGISQGISKGGLIGLDNVAPLPAPDYEKLANNFSQPAKDRFQSQSAINRSFEGYVRKDGRVGTRNYYLILPTSLCASDLAQHLANKFDEDENLEENYPSIDGVVAAAHTEGCGCSDGIIIERLLLTLKNTIANPNVEGVLVIDLGCEKTSEEVVRESLTELGDLDKPVDYLSIQEVGGTGKALAQGSNIISKRLPEIAAHSREPVSISKLTVGTECGASNTFSGITANPIIGNVVDKIVYSGGSALISETPEMVDAEPALVERMRSVNVVNKFLEALTEYKTLASKLGASLEGNLVPANKKEGLLTPALKSLGAITKCGSAEIVDFLDYAEALKKPGVSIMNGPGNDPESVTGLAASGANIILFSTGLGTNGGSLFTPVIKIPSTSEVFTRLSDDMDFDAGRFLTENITVDELGDELLDLLIDVASGAKKTCSEIWKNRFFQVWSAGKISL